MKSILFAIVFSMLGTMHIAHAAIFETKCSGVIFKVQATNKGHPLDNEYVLYVDRLGKLEKLYTAREGGWFHAACLKGVNGREYLLFQSYCGGSGCIEDRYGVVDPVSRKLLLEPGKENVDNSDKASKILEFRVPHLPNYKDTFCCGR